MLRGPGRFELGVLTGRRASVTIPLQGDQGLRSWPMEGGVGLGQPKAEGQLKHDVRVRRGAPSLWDQS